MLQQLVGNRAALSVTADAKPLPLAQALAQTGPWRLAWCLTAFRDGPDLRWLHPRSHPPECPREHVIDHLCPAQLTFDL